MLKVMMLLKRKPGLSMEEFIEHYERVHVPLAEQNAARLTHYARHYLHPAPDILAGGEPLEPEYDVITEIWYESTDAFKEQGDAMRGYPERIAAIIADEEQLFDRAKSRTVFVEDRVSDLPHVSKDDRDRSVQRLLDKDAIVDLVHRYSYFVDHKRHDEIADLFTDDCVLDYGPGIGAAAHGRAAVRAMFGRGAQPTAARPGFVATSHHNANVIVTFDSDDRASVRTSMYAWHQTADGRTPRVWGYYHDVAVRTPEGWRLAERQLRIAGNQGWAIDWLPLIDRAEK